MVVRAFFGCTIAFLIIQPSRIDAQSGRSAITFGDIERAVRIGRVVLGSRSVSSRTGRAAVATGSDYVGVPYVWGGSTPAGFDCSGFVQYVYREHGVQLPRTSRQMAHAGKRIHAAVGALREGDLMLFRGKNGVISHVALYAGHNLILHSSSSGNGVRYDDLSTRRGDYFRSHLAVARRVTENGRSLVEALASIYLKYPFVHFLTLHGAPRVKR